MQDSEVFFKACKHAVLRTKTVKQPRTDRINGEGPQHLPPVIRGDNWSLEQAGRRSSLGWGRGLAEPCAALLRVMLRLVRGEGQAEGGPQVLHQQDTAAACSGTRGTSSRLLLNNFLPGFACEYTDNARMCSAPSSGSRSWWLRPAVAALCSGGQACDCFQGAAGRSVWAVCPLWPPRADKPPPGLADRKGLTGPGQLRQGPGAYCGGAERW